MIELPEAATLARQMEETLAGKTIRTVVAGQSPHKFAFFTGDAAEYPARLSGRTVSGAAAYGGIVRMMLGADLSLCLNDGARPQYLAPGAALPAKHQLLLGFADGSHLAFTVQMYGAFLLRPDGGSETDFYYDTAREKPSPLTDAFSEGYFLELARNAKQTLSAKAFLATEQRIPGLGNGVLQDILFYAGIHPKTKLEALDAPARKKLYRQVKQSLADMTRKGGRDSERDLFGGPGGYQTVLSSKTAGQPCPVCGGPIVKQAYLGGSVYFCPVCQR